MSRRLQLIATVALVGVAASVFVVTRASGSATPPFLSYSAKFACGEFGKLIPARTAATVEGPVKPGNYQTVINVHNPLAGVPVPFIKKAVLIYSGANPVNQTTGFEAVKQPAPQRTANLPPDAGMMIDCQDIRKVLLVGGPVAPPAAPTFIEGWVIIQAPYPTGTSNTNPLDVTAMYTSNGYDCTPPAAGGPCPAASVIRVGFSQHIETINAKTIIK